MKKKYLVLHLSGATQHYSLSDPIKLDNGVLYYKAIEAPTRNAVSGMIGAALGYRHYDEEYSKKMNNLRDKLDFKYRIIRKGSIISDDEMLGDQMVRVDYLWDYAFEVYISADEKTLKSIYDACIHPVYPPYLGKIDCTPRTCFVTREYKLETIDNISDLHDCP